jgi:hypothetical protein
VSNLLDVLRGTAGEIFPASEAQISRELAALYRRWLSVAPAGRAPFDKNVNFLDYRQKSANCFTIDFSDSIDPEHQIIS